MKFRIKISCAGHEFDMVCEYGSLEEAQKMNEGLVNGLNLGLSPGAPKGVLESVEEVPEDTPLSKKYSAGKNINFLSKR